MNTIGGRVAAALAGRTQKGVAEEVDMTPDAFSRALRGERGFAAIELARLADVLHEDVHFLITGEPDPHALVVSARHAWNPEDGSRAVPSADRDGAILDDIGLAYAQAGPGGSEVTLPRTPAQVRDALGSDFVRPFLARLERLGVDVVRVAELSTSYSFTAGGRPVIALNATGNWFRENWGLAHELGHLVAGDAGIMPGSARQNDAERDANTFAADLLMPRQMVEGVTWSDLPLDRLAELVWEWGVSTEALKNRLAKLRVEVSPDVAEVLTWTTQKLLHRHGAGALRDEITARMDAAATRVFPSWLRERHLDLIATGGVGKGTLAWMLGVPPDGLEVDEPTPPPALDDAELDGLWG